MDTTKLKPTVEEIVRSVLKFPLNDQRREQLWSLIIKDKELTRQLVAKLKLVK